MSQARLGGAAREVEWICASVTEYAPDHKWDAWHDRALLHFCTRSVDRRAYLRALEASLRPGGVAVLGIFGPRGPEHCSGLAVRRFDAEGLARFLGPSFVMEAAFTADHHTPWGSSQEFLYSRFRRRS